MTKNDYIFGGLELVLWYIFMYLFIYSIKHDVNLFVMSFILLALFYAASIACPLMRNTDAWLRLFPKSR